MLAILLGLLSLLILVKPVLAGEAPTQLSPANNATVSSSALNWQAPAYTLYPTSPYRVQVDDDSSFASLNKDYYTSNTHYTPTLIPGTWFWRVKAKDETGVWSNWSNVWSFILSDSKSSPSPPPSPVPSSSSDFLSTPTPQTSFTVTNTPSQIGSDQSFNVSINLSLSENPNSVFYLKGAFKKTDGSNYFGQTKVSGNWVKNGSSFSSQYQITTDSSGNWSGNLEIQPDAEDSGFTGTGDYIFKVGRYTSSGSGPSWSSESTIKIIASENTSTKTTTSESNSVVSPSVETLTKTTSSPIAKTYVKLAYRQASIAGAKAITSASALPSPQTTVKTQKQVNPLIWAGLSLILLGSGSVGYIYYKNGKIHF